jgi:hypothetical protein
MIRKTKNGWEVRSETTGRRLGGPYPTKEQATKRLQQVEFFKHNASTKKKSGRR